MVDDIDLLCGKKACHKGQSLYFTWKLSLTFPAISGPGKVPPAVTVLKEVFINLPLQSNDACGMLVRTIEPIRCELRIDDIKFIRYDSGKSMVGHGQGGQSGKTCRVAHYEHLETRGKNEVWECSGVGPPRSSTFYAVGEGKTKRMGFFRNFCLFRG